MQLCRSWVRTAVEGEGQSGIEYPANSDVPQFPVVDACLVPDSDEPAPCRFGRSNLGVPTLRASRSLLARAHSMMFRDEHGTDMGTAGGRNWCNGNRLEESIRWTEASICTSTARTVHNQ